MTSRVENPFVRSKILAQTAAHWGCSPVENYKIDKQIGEGTYGKVYKCHRNSDKMVVAWKKIRTDFSRANPESQSDRQLDGFPLTAIREISLLMHLKHPRIVNLIEVAVSTPEKYFAGEGAVVIIFEYCEHDLAGLHNLSNSSSLFTPPAIKFIMLQLLQSIAHCHSHGVLHRDIKMSNVLINAKGDLKLWYRAPEIFLGDRSYTNAIDIWSVGCIFAELLTGEAVFRSNTDSEAVNKIWDLCGSPANSGWKDVEQLPLFKSFGGSVPKKNRLREHFSNIPQDCLDLLESLLKLDPEQRISAKDALYHHYFTSEPAPVCIGAQEVEESHEYEVRQQRKARSQAPPMPTAKRARIGP
ncbi:hypothetical protein GEMRC1_008869 [Eukaryota sp. GEM-RC1]